MTPDKLRPPCPICGKPVHADFRPFCSKRCADIDLGKWFSDAYVVPGDPISSDEIPEGDGPDRAATE